jgi:predicted transposase YbfD/YdcC
MEYSTLEAWQEISETGIVYSLGSLYGMFEQWADPRKPKGKRYHLLTLLVIILLAKLCGKDRPMEIADWAKNHTGELVEMLKLDRSWMPHHNTIRRVFQDIISAAEFDRLAQTYHQQEQCGRGSVLSMDGKALRGTRLPGHERSEQVLSVYNGCEQLVLAQASVATKENEIPVARQLLQQVTLKDKIVTADALHTQREVSAYIVKQGGEYIWPVKGNQPRLYEAIERLFVADQPKPGFGKITADFESVTKTNLGHGRLERRTLQTSSMLNDYLDWPGVSQVYRLERKFSWVRRGKVYRSTCEVEYGITSLTREEASPTKLLQIRRSHWLVETGLHYRRDVTFHEDATRMTLGDAGRNLATVHNLVIGLIKRAGFKNAAQARRYFEGHLEEAFQLLISTRSTPRPHASQVV